MQSFQLSLELVLFNTHSMITRWRNLLKKFKIPPARAFFFSVRNLADRKEKTKIYYLGYISILILLEKHF